MKTSPKQFVMFCLSLLSFLILSISISAAEIKADTIIPIRLDFKNQYLVKTEDGCVFLTDDLFTSNRTILSEKANFLSEEYFITTDNEYSYLRHLGSKILCDVSKSESNNTDIIQSCTAEEATYSSTYLLYHDGELRTAKKDKFIMGNVREMGCFREYLWAITNDNMLYIGHEVNTPEDMVFLSNNVYKYENCMIVDYNGLVSYYNPHGSDYAISLCKIDNLDNTLELWYWNYEYYACIQTAKSSTSASTTTHIIYEAESGKKITSFQNAKQIAYNTGRYIAEISNDYNHANIYTISDLTKNKKILSNLAHHIILAE